MCQLLCVALTWSGQMEQLKKQLKKANDEAEDSAAEVSQLREGAVLRPWAQVKRLQKSNYALQDTLARQQSNTECSC